MSEIPYMMANTREEFERVRNLAWPAPAPSPAEQAVIDRFGIFDVERAALAMYRHDTGATAPDADTLPFAEAYIPLAEVAIAALESPRLTLGEQIAGVLMDPDSWKPGLVHRAVTSLRPVNGSGRRRDQSR